LPIKSVSNNIQNKIAEIDEITKDIKNEESAMMRTILKKLFR
jgi:hypothetical protein